MKLLDFVIECLTDEARLAQQVAAQWAHEQPPRQHHMPVSDFINRYDPNAVMRAVEAARDVIGRHRPATEEEENAGHYGEPGKACAGCGDYDTDMGHMEWNVDDIDECPELRALAWRWNHRRAWDKRWCLHLVTKELNTTAFEDLARNVRTYVKVCRRCDRQIGDMQEAPHITVKP